MADKQRFLFRVQKCQDEERPPTIYYFNDKPKNTFQSFQSRITKTVDLRKNARTVPEIYLEASKYYKFKVNKYEDDDTVPTIKHSQTTKNSSSNNQNLQQQQKILNPNKYLSKNNRKLKMQTVPTIYFDKSKQNNKINQEMNRNKQFFRVTKYNSQQVVPSVFFQSQVRQKSQSKIKVARSQRLQEPTRKQFQFRVSSAQKNRTPSIRFSDKGDMKIHNASQQKHNIFSFRVTESNQNSNAQTIHFSQTFSHSITQNKNQKKQRNSQINSFKQVNYQRQNMWIPQTNSQQIYEYKTIISKKTTKEGGNPITAEIKNPSFNLQAKKQNKLYSKKLQTLKNFLAKDQQEMKLSTFTDRQTKINQYIVPSNDDLNNTAPVKSKLQNISKNTRTVQAFNTISQSENSYTDSQAKLQLLRSKLLYQQKLAKSQKSNEKKMKESFLNQLSSIEIQIKGLLEQTQQIAKSLKGDQQSDNEQFEQLAQSKYHSDYKKDLAASTLKNSSYNQSYKLRSLSSNRSKQN